MTKKERARLNDIMQSWIKHRTISRHQSAWVIAIADIEDFIDDTDRHKQKRKEQHDSSR